jgi:hypothetical protein
LKIDENETVVDTLAASDPEGDNIILSLSGGDDKDLFTLDEQNGQLAFNAAPDHETPADANSDNRYQLQVQASDGNGRTTQDVTVAVQNLNDNPPTITKSTYEIDENTTSIGTISASDPDGDDLTYELNGGVDEDFFTLDTQTGALSFNSPPDYEQPSDGRQIGYPTDNEYDFSIVVRDGENLDVGSITVIVQNVAEPPQFERGIIGSYGTGSSGNPYIFNAVPAGTDLANYLDIDIYFKPESEPVSNVTLGGTDANLFSAGSPRLNTATGKYNVQITGPANLDYNHSPDHRYEFTLTAETDAGDTATATFIIPIRQFNGGSGTESDPYQVANVYQLQIVGQHLDSHFIQIQDIDASATANWNPVPPDGTPNPDPPRGFEPIGDYNDNFIGSYDGNGYKITGFTIQRLQSLESRIGLFGVIGEDGVVKNVHIDGYISADLAVGGIAGTNSGTIENSSSSVDIVCFSGTCGVLAGGNNVNGIIRNSFATANIDENNDTIGGLVGDNSMDALIINSYATGNVSGDWMVGGLVGNNAGMIRQSFATGNVTGTQSIGGLVGNNVELIQNSYAIGDVSGTSRIGGLVGVDAAGTYLNTYAIGAVSNVRDEVGGLVGKIDLLYSGGNTPTFTNSYWNTETTGQSTSPGGTPLNTNNMTGSNASTYMNFDFDTIWQEGGLGEYPFLRNNPPPGN